ncbi:TenA family transcriptional regulator [Brachybacterium sp. P6-10-X1]|uniref:TenA family protein n=1 Tax=Brachybacterium sp. P6-10-X1 TaxID=1903186 RepID=UPI0009717E9A|nr:TenA family protein [Brachybacterium sp. P6-10-X1]APX33906.1 TenA family transcriptional regulator [Brachybacterium sp. P6-10-X1]
MSTSFTRALREGSEPTWSRAVGHRFVRELHTGEIPDHVMAGYLVQDHRFLDRFLALLGAAVATADTLDARLRLARFAGEVAGDENTFFLRAFESLGVTEQQRARIPDTPATAGFLALFDEAAASRDYAEILAVLLVTEWLYLDWAQAAPRPRPESFVHAEWIALHDNPAFVELVSLLRGELDRVGPGRADAARARFERAVQLELDFFDQAYARPLGAVGAPAASAAPDASTGGAR